MANDAIARKHPMNDMKKITDYEIAVERRLEKACERDGWVASAHVSFGAEPFLDAWGGSGNVNVKIRCLDGDDVFRFTLADVGHADAGSIRTAPRFNIAGQPMHSSTMNWLTNSLTISSGQYNANFDRNSALLVCEAAKPTWLGLLLTVEVDGSAMYSFRLPMSMSTVDDMYRYVSIRDAFENEMTSFSGTDGSIVTNAVFDRGVSAMFNPSISDYDKADILAFHIPAVSSPAGKVATLRGENSSFDMNIDGKANDWGRAGIVVEDEHGEQHLETPWLHSDIKNMAYYYVYPAFTNIVEKGEMK